MALISATSAFAFGVDECLNVTFKEIRYKLLPFLIDGLQLRLEQHARCGRHPAHIVREREAELREQGAQPGFALIDLLEGLLVDDRHPHADLAGDVALLKL
jgi:hypothetical protein